MKTNTKYGNHGRRSDATHAVTVNKPKFTHEKLTEKAVMFIHSGLVSQTIYCIV